MDSKNPDLMRVSDLLINYLEQEQVRYIFGITGKTISPVFDSALNSSTLKMITTAHEAGAAFMAYGYSQATGRLSVCCATTGGGITNLTTGVASAYVHSLPMLVITGQIPTSQFGKNGFQESTGLGRTLNSVYLLKQVCKDSFMLTCPDKAADAFQYALRLALSHRQGPVHINIPIDVQLALIEKKTPVLRSLFIPQNQPGSSTKTLTTLLDQIEKSSKPVLLMGWGAILSQAQNLIIQFCELLNIPIATTVQGKGGVDANHPLCLGVMGLCGHQSARTYLLEKSDLIIAVGTSLGEFNTLNWDPKFGQNKHLIQIDIDPSEIGKNYPVHTPVIGDAYVIFEQLIDTLKIRSLKPKNYPLTSLQTHFNWNKCLNPEKTTSKQTPILPQTLLKELREHTPDSTLFLGDSSAHWCWMNHYLPIFKGGMYYPTQGLGSMGTGIASAIGIKLAKPHHPVVCICGDGSFLMHGNEVATAVHYAIAVIWIIFNDQRYAMPFIGTEKLYGPGRAESSCSLPAIDFVKVAEGYGAKAYQVTSPGQIADILKEALALNKPVVIDVKINTQEIPPLGERLSYG